MQISVYVTSYNQREYLKEAVLSVLGQTRPPDQLIIIDDCSQDGSQDLIDDFYRQYPDLIIPVYQEVNQGVTRCRMKALAYATGELISYLDGDDRFLPEKLARESALFAEDSSVDLVYSNFRYINDQGEETGIWSRGGPLPEGNTFPEVFSRGFPKHTIFRNELVRAGVLGDHPYDPALNLYEDWDMRIRLSQFARIRYCPDLLTEYRIHHRSLSQTDLDHHLQAVRYIIEKNSPLLDSIEPRRKTAILRDLSRWQAEIAEKAAIQRLDQHGVGEMFGVSFWKNLCFWSAEGKLWIPTQLLARVLLGKTIYNKVLRK